MIPIEQQEMWTPEGNRGDCMRACIASVLELPLEAVPHFAASDSWRGDLDAWLGARGLAWHTFRVTDDPPSARPEITVGGYWFAAVRSRRILLPCGACSPADPGYMNDRTTCPFCRGWGKRQGEHLVVMHDDEIVWDPHPLRSDGHGGFTEGAFLRVIDPALLREAIA